MEVDNLNLKEVLGLGDFRLLSFEAIQKWFEKSEFQTRSFVSYFVVASRQLEVAFPSCGLKFFLLVRDRFLTLNLECFSFVGFVKSLLPGDLHGSKFRFLWFLLLLGFQPLLFWIRVWVLFYFPFSPV